MGREPHGHPVAGVTLFRGPRRQPAPDPVVLLHGGAGPALEGEGGRVRARPTRARVVRELLTDPELARVGLSEWEGRPDPPDDGRGARRYVLVRAAGMTSELPGGAEGRGGRAN